MIYLNAKLNEAHQALAKLEVIGKLKTIITQNIDGLYQQAGLKTIYELHGTIHHNLCNKCHKDFSLEYILKIIRLYQNMMNAEQLLNLI